MVGCSTYRLRLQIQRFRPGLGCPALAGGVGWTRWRRLACREPLDGFGCGLPLTGRPGRLPVACPCRPSLTTCPTGRLAFLVRRAVGEVGWRRSQRHRSDCLRCPESNCDLFQTDVMSGRSRPTARPWRSTAGRRSSRSSSRSASGMSLRRGRACLGRYQEQPRLPVGRHPRHEQRVLRSLSRPSVSPTRISPRCGKTSSTPASPRAGRAVQPAGSVHRHDHGLFEEPGSRPRLPALGPLRAGIRRMVCFAAGLLGRRHPDMGEGQSVGRSVSCRSATSRD